MKHIRPLAKYVVSGGSAAVVNLGLLYILTEYAHLYYLLSAVCSFLAAFFISFLLQKFWTFADKQTTNMHWQMASFFAVSLCNLLLNTALLYVLVDFFHIWYIAAEVCAGIFLAAITFFVYRHVIFSGMIHRESVIALLKRARKYAPASLLFLGVAIMVFLSFYKLTESPPTWLDEGIVMQTAVNVAEHGPHAVLQTAPGIFVSGGYVSTSYPATYPVAAALYFFGIGIVQARAVMAVFVILFVLAAYRLLKKESGASTAAWALLLLATFAPLYGNGKNVLGEVPGLLYLTIFLLFIKKIETKETKPLDFIWAGIFLGLAVVTKSIFLLLLVPVGIVFLFSRRLLTVRKSIAAVCGFVLPMLVWLYTQFGNETLGGVLTIYANPHGNDFAASLWQNALGFVTKPEPLYALALLLVWLAAIAVRIWKKEKISRAEYIAAGFAALVYIAFLRGADYYRYFFLGEVLALTYLPQALTALRPKKLPVYALYIFLALLVSFQLYQSLFKSWVAEHYASTRSAQLMALESLPKNSSVFIYQAPEAVVFLPPGIAYYQYLDITKVIIIGREEIPLIAQGVPDAVVIQQEDISAVDLSRYALAKTLDRYTLWEKKK